MSYRWNALNFGMTWRYLPSVDNRDLAINPASTVQGTGSHNLFNLFGSYSLGNMTFRAGVDNVLDKEPLVVGANIGNAAGVGRDSNSDTTQPSFYDPLGRRYYVGMKVSF